MGQLATEPARDTRPDTAGEAARAPARDPARWLRWSLAALGTVTVLLLTTGLYLTVKYRPGSRIDTDGADSRPALVATSQIVHAVGAYAFVLLVCVVVGLALVVANRRNSGSGVILASGFGLFIVSIGFLITGLQLPWRGFVWAASFSPTFDGIIGFPRGVVAVLVGNGDMTPARYETVAWIHIAGLPVFAVFATWWMLGAVHASRDAEPRRAAASGDGPAGTAPAHPVSLAEQFFGTDDPDTVRLQVDAFLHRYLHTNIGALDFTRTGTGIVLGVQLTDGRATVVRLYPPGSNAAYLRALQDVQLHLAAQGFPAPRPLLEPVPFGVGLATVETRLPDPPAADPTDRATRRALAEGLAAFVHLTAPIARHAELAGRGPLGPPAPGSVFPAAPGSPFDFPATAAGAEWIEEIGARARALLDAAPMTVPVVGHFAWRVETVPVADGRIQAVFDWESVGSAPEAVVIGSAAHQFTIDGRSERPHVPTVDEIQQFVIDYEQGRGTPLAGQERVLARAAYVYCTAYGARCEHVLAVTGQAVPAGFRERLAAHGAALLA